MRSAFNTFTLALMPIAIVINIMIGQLIDLLRLPLYLDQIGTIMVGVLAGPLGGAVTGLLSGVIWSLLFDLNGFWFAPSALVVGLLAGMFGARSWLRKRKLPTLVLFGGLLTGIGAALVRIIPYVVNRLPEHSMDLLLPYFQNLTGNPIGAYLFQGVLFDPLDKIISYLIVFLILTRLPRRLLVRFPQGTATARARRRALIGYVDDD